MLAKIKAFFQRIWAMCFRSVTIAWSYLLGIFGAVMSQLDGLAALLNDPGLTQNVQSLIGDAKSFGKWLMVVAVVNIVARARSLIKGS